MHGPRPLTLTVSGDARDASALVTALQGAGCAVHERPDDGALVLAVELPAERDDAVIEAHGVRIDRVAHRVWRGERIVELTRTELALLEDLVRHADEVRTRTQLHLAVWNYDFGPDSNSLGVYVGYLRRKLEEAGEARLLQTVRGVGYVLRP